MDDLDRLIADWGRSRRMPDATADRIRGEIVADEVRQQDFDPTRVTVPVLSADWWLRLNRRTNLVLADSLLGWAA